MYVWSRSALVHLFCMFFIWINHLVCKPTMIFFQLSFLVCLLPLLEISCHKSLWRRQGETLYLSLKLHSSWESVVLLLSVN